MAKLSNFLLFPTSEIFSTLSFPSKKKFLLSTQAAMSSAGDGEAVANAFVATVVSACSGGVVALVAFRVRTGYWKIVPTINGALVRGNACSVFLPFTDQRAE